MVGKRSRPIPLIALIALLLVLTARPAFATAGDPDLTFGQDGFVRTKFSFISQEGAFGVALDDRGRIVAVGGNEGKFAVARYRPNGRLDRLFAGDGKVTSHIQDGPAVAEDVAIEVDGRIVAAGFLSRANGTGGFALLRYRSSGHPDRSFGVNGRVITEFGRVIAEGTSIAIQPNGKIVVAGGFRNKFALARYLSDGSLDRSFGSGGLVTTNLGPGEEVARDVAIRSDGKIVVVGGTNGRFGVVRYRRDGVPDPRF
jgi:uncharacterized delta-60 repeat protein